MSTPKRKIRCHAVGSLFKKSNSAGIRSTVELAKHMEGRDKTDETDAHDEHDGRRDLQAGSVVGVEPQHVGAGAGSTSDCGGAVPPASAKTAAAHTGGRSGGAARSHDSGACGCRTRGLRLRRTSGHGRRAAKITKVERKKRV